jgi:hypothetical protein
MAAAFDDLCDLAHGSLPLCVLAELEQGTILYKFLEKKDTGKPEPQFIIRLM